MRKLLIVFLAVFPTVLFAQNIERYYDDSDTLLIVGGQIVDSDHFMMDRNLLIKNDTILVNRPGFNVDSFVFSAFALGQKVAVNNQGNVFNDEVIDHLINKESIFKFFYLKDIILRTSDGRMVSPSTRTIKITFTN